RRELHLGHRHPFQQAGRCDHARDAPMALARLPEEGRSERPQQSIIARAARRQAGGSLHAGSRAVARGRLPCHASGKKGHWRSRPVKWCLFTHGTFYAGTSYDYSMMPQPPIPRPLWNIVLPEAQAALLTVPEALEQRIVDLETGLNRNSK